jgi:hypothetical protein
VSASLVIELDTHPPQLALGGYGVSFGDDLLHIAYSVNEPGVTEADITKAATTIPLDITSNMLTATIPSDWIGSLASVHASTVDVVGNEAEYDFLIVIPSTEHRSNKMPTGGVVIVSNTGGSVPDHRAGGEVVQRLRAGDVWTNRTGGEVDERRHGGVVRDPKRAGDLLVHMVDGDVIYRLRSGTARNPVRAGNVHDNNRTGEVRDNARSGDVQDNVRDGDLLTHNTAGQAVDRNRGGQVRENERSGDLLTYDAGGKVKDNRTGGNLG